MKKNWLMAVAVSAAMGVAGAALGAGGGGGGGGGGGAGGGGAGGAAAGGASAGAVGGAGTGGAAATPGVAGTAGTATTPGVAGSAGTATTPGAAGSAGTSAGAGTAGTSAGVELGIHPQIGANGAPSTLTQAPGVRTTGQAGTATQGQTTNSSVSTTSNVGVTLSPRQQARIRTVLMRDRNIPQVNNPTFNVAVGATVPNNTQLAPLPSAVLRLYRGFRGDRVTMVGNELVIVNPSSYQIVAVLSG